MIDYFWQFYSKIEESSGDPSLLMSVDCALTCSHHRFVCTGCILFLFVRFAHLFARVPGSPGYLLLLENYPRLT